MAILIKCDVCSRSINERSATWAEVTTHRGENPRVNHVCSPDCGEAFFLRLGPVGQRPNFDQAREILAATRDRLIAESWDNEDSRSVVS